MTTTCQRCGKQIKAVWQVVTASGAQYVGRECVRIMKAEGTGDLAQRVTIEQAVECSVVDDDFAAVNEYP